MHWGYSFSIGPSTPGLSQQVKSSEISPLIQEASRVGLTTCALLLQPDFHTTMSNQYPTHSERIAQATSLHGEQRWGEEEGIFCNSRQLVGLKVPKQHQGNKQHRCKESLKTHTWSTHNHSLTTKTGVLINTSFSTQHRKTQENFLHTRHPGYSK